MMLQEPAWRDVVAAGEGHRGARAPPCVESACRDSCSSCTQGIATSKRHGQCLPCYGALTCSSGAPRGIRTPNRQIRSLVLYVGLVGSGPIWAAHVACLVDLVGSKPVPSDRLDDQPDDQATAVRSLPAGALRGPGNRRDGHRPVSPRHALGLGGPAPGLPSTSHPLVGVRRLESTADLKPLAGGRQTGHDPPPA
jgi:hypothetical protein